MKEQEGDMSQHLSNWIYKLFLLEKLTVNTFFQRLNLSMHTTYNFIIDAFFNWYPSAQQAF